MWEAPDKVTIYFPTSTNAANTWSVLMPNRHGGSALRPEWAQLGMAGEFVQVAFDGRYLLGQVLSNQFLRQSWPSCKLSVLDGLDPSG
jgi:hypothetical protein